MDLKTAKEDVDKVKDNQTTYEHPKHFKDLIERIVSYEKKKMGINKQLGNNLLEFVNIHNCRKASKIVFSNCSATLAQLKNLYDLSLVNTKQIGKIHFLIHFMIMMKRRNLTNIS